MRKHNRHECQGHETSGGEGKCLPKGREPMSNHNNNPSSILLGLGLGVLYLFIGFIVPSAASATNYFNWGVEHLRPSFGVNGTAPYQVQFHGATTKDCRFKHGGSCSMKMQVIGNDHGNQGMGADLVVPPPPYPWPFVGGQAVYYRWWMNITPGFRWGNGAAITKASRTGGSPKGEGDTWEQGYTGYLRSYGFLLGGCSSYSPPQCTRNDGGYADRGFLIPYKFREANDGIWHEYIVKIKPNTSGSCTAPQNCDAQFQAWVDGVSVGQYNNFKLHTNTSDSEQEEWGGWMVFPYWQLDGTTSDGGTIYVDDFSTDTVYNSSIATPPRTRSRCTGLKGTSGSSGSDKMRGTRGRDVLHARRANDVVRGRGGRDTLCGGRGGDLVKGNGDSDLLRGGGGFDICSGGQGRDVAGASCEVVHSARRRA